MSRAPENDGLVTSGIREIGAPESLLDGLDENQRRAAQALRGPVCVLAGAGTGKTRAITHRIAYGVATGAYAPNRVLALTFTSRSASELRSRLRDLGAPGVAARTFHSAALSQLNYFWPLVVGHPAPTVLDGKARALGHVAHALGLKIDTATLRDLAAEIEWRKLSQLSIAQYASIAVSRPTLASLTLDQMAALHQAYEDLKDARRQIDFEDVLLVTTGMIESEPKVALQVREQYRFFIVDEFQDVSPLQKGLLDAWVGERRDVCVVGDANQTIYSFAGATSEYLVTFENRYEGAQVVRLDNNYRSTPEIVDTANRLMRGHAGAVVLTSHGTNPSAAGSAREFERVQVDRYSSDVHEARGVAERVASRIAEGVRPQDIAVLYRLTVQSAAIEVALAELGVSSHLRGAQRFFDLIEVKQAVSHLRAASVSISGEPLFKSVSDVLRSLGLTDRPPASAGALRNRWESLNALMTLADQAPRDTSFREFTDQLLERQSTHHEPTLSAVTLVTVHAAKGLEWDEVHIVGLSEGLLPISYARTPAQIEEERRLLYVGITRARRKLWMSWATSGANVARERRRSRFLEEFGSHTPSGART